MPKGSPKKRPARVALPRGGATYTFTMDRGEMKARCKGCNAVVPISSWWQHVCQVKP